jgi:hypothetical protein
MLIQYIEDMFTSFTKKGCWKRTFILWVGKMMERKHDDFLDTATEMYSVKNCDTQIAS